MDRGWNGPEAFAANSAHAAKFQLWGRLITSVEAPKGNMWWDSFCNLYRNGRAWQQIRSEGAAAELLPYERRLAMTPESESESKGRRPASTNGNGRLWTVMVYMAADTGESFYRKAMEDITEMTEAEFDDRVKVVVHADAPSPWLAKCWEVNGGTKGSEGRGRATASDCKHKYDKPVLDFVSWCAKNYQAERYLLVLWGHGEGIDWKQKALGGSARGKGFAPGAQSASEVGKLGKALKEMNLGVTAKNVVVGFDACLMGMVEVYYEINDHVGWAVSPNDEIPDTGWPYKEILNKLGKKPDMDPDSLARAIVRQCAKWYSKNSPESDVSFSACDLAESQGLKAAVKALRIELEKQVDTELGLKAIREAREFAEDYQERAYVDLNAFCKALERAAGRKTKNAVVKAAAQWASEGPGQPTDDTVLKDFSQKLAGRETNGVSLVDLQEPPDDVAEALKELRTRRGLESTDEAMNEFCQELDQRAAGPETDGVKLADLKEPAKQVVEALKKFVINRGVEFSDEYPHRYRVDARAVSICFPESEDLEGSMPGFQINWENYKELRFTDRTGGTDWPSLIEKFWDKPRLD